MNINPDTPPYGLYSNEEDSTSKENVATLTKENLEKAFNEDSNRSQSLYALEDSRPPSSLGRRRTFINELREDDLDLTDEEKRRSFYFFNQEEESSSLNNFSEEIQIAPSTPNDSPNLAIEIPQQSSSTHSLASPHPNHIPPNLNREKISPSNPPLSFDPDITSISIKKTPIVEKINVIRPRISKMGNHRPVILYLFTLAQVIMFIFSLIKNTQLTGSAIQTQPQFNILIGPSPYALIASGGNYTPCMRSSSFENERLSCPSPNSQIPNRECSLEELCGLNGFQSGSPDQWFRFFTPMFLHGGIIHILFNLFEQLALGVPMERDYGWWRMFLIYGCSGVGASILSGLLSPFALVSVGASGALFGLLGCQFLEIFWNWHRLAQPVWELIKFSFILLINFAFGLIPNIDNFAHIGGFLTGILVGLTVLPRVNTNPKYIWLNAFLKTAALAVLAASSTIALLTFYSNRNPADICPWCLYLTCLPINGWCDQYLLTSTSSSL